MLGTKGRSGPPVNELVLDRECGLDETTFEIIRIWAQHRGPSQTFLDPTRISDPEAFGALMATALHDASRAYAEEYGLDGNVALNRIFQAMYKHLTDPQGSAAESRVRILGQE
jgi:hypothetical protein